jgi:hypothetical protein
VTPPWVTWSKTVVVVSTVPILSEARCATVRTMSEAVTCVYVAVRRPRNKRCAWS